MKTNTIYEEPMLFYQPEYHGQDSIGEDDCYSVILYADDLKSAKVGTTWSCRDQDRYPNGQRYWTVSFEMIAKKSDGCAILQRGNYSGETHRELIWCSYGNTTRGEDENFEK